MSDRLDLKIRQMHAALAGLATNDLSTIQPEITSEFGRVYMKVDFDRNSDPIDLANAATLLIANIASINDHLKLWCKKQNVPFEGEALINRNKAVALIHDLWNTDKHGELNSPPRSGHKPQLKDLKTVMQVSSGQGRYGFIGWNVRTGETTMDVSDDRVFQLALAAQIIDEAGNILGDFTQTCMQAVEAWSKALSDAGMPLPS